MLKFSFYVTIALVFFFLYKKRKPRPTKLDLSSFKNRVKGPTLTGVKKVYAEVVEGSQSKKNRKDIFILNGKKYNAWQVLGLPLGADLNEIKKAYADKVNLDPKNKSLYVKALQALK